MNESYPHTMKPADIIRGIDGDVFKKQRRLLYRVLDQLKGTEEDEGTMEGLCNLIEMIADCAHDRYGIDCLFSEEENPVKNAEAAKPPRRRFRPFTFDELKERFIGNVWTVRLKSPMSQHETYVSVVCISQDVEDLTWITVSTRTRFSCLSPENFLQDYVNADGSLLGVEVVDDQ